jgi:DNA-3-methyladenine glycosylase II
MHYIEHLSKDKKLKKLIEQQGLHKLQPHHNICMRLCISIMSQQLSTKVAHVFHNRFLELFKGKDPTPKQILAIPYETLRSIGLSHAKATYVHNIAQFAIEYGLDGKKMAALSDEELIEYMSKIKGVGRWTAEMLLMFTMGREDLFALDDLGLQQAMMKLYRLDNSDKKKFREDLTRISKKWSPYRTYACLYLWGMKDNSPT